MSSDRPMTPYAPFEEPPATESAPAPRTSSRPPPDFARMIREELELVEQSITENVKHALQKLGTIVLDEIARTNVRLDGHRRELATLRDAFERTGVILPPPPEGL